MTGQTRPQVVIIGAGFGGLFAARTLAKKSVDVLLIDRQNFHTFTPLLYQVATCGLDPSEITYPIRTIFRRAISTRFLMGEVLAINHEQRQITVKTSDQTLYPIYDYLILAAGSVTNYFGMVDLEQHGFGLKDLRDAVTLRNHILKLFEQAAWADDPNLRQSLTTFVVVGGGPTGLETAGALHELYNHVLQQEYGQTPSLQARVILVEATDHVLAPYPDRLKKAALEQLESLGVEVILGSTVEKVESTQIHLSDGRTIPSHTLIWAAGVKAAPLAEMLDLPLVSAGRVPINPTMEVIGRDRIYVVGDMAYLEDEDGYPYPMLIPVANQQGELAARNIMRRLRGDREEVFHYSDRGIMATIGRSRAVAWLFNRIQLSGWLAWQAWLWFHLVALMGFRNRLSVFISWVWNYWTYDRSVRIILERDPHRLDRIDPDGEETVPGKAITP